jgi:hypothetical protein
MLNNILLRRGNVVTELSQQFLLTESHLLILQRRAHDRELGDMEPRHVVHEHHIEWRRGGSFFHVCCDLDTLKIRSSEEQTLQFRGIPVVIEVDGQIGCEERIKGVAGEGVRMRALVLEDHDVRYVDDAHAEIRYTTSQEGGGLDDFEHELCADTDEDDVRIEAFVCAAEFPD